MKVYHPDFWPCCISIRIYFRPMGGDKRTDSTQINCETGVNSNQNETNIMENKKKLKFRRAHLSHFGHLSHLFRSS